jgi:hypothetical protein
MPSQSTVILLVYLYIAICIWHLVLRKTAYPEYIPTHLKWIHALFLFFVWSSAFYLFFRYFLWLVFHPSEVVACFTSQPNQIGDLSVGIAGIIQGLAGTFLMPICHRMAKRQGNVLKWYFLLWPLAFISSSYIFVHGHSKIETHSIIPIVTTVIFQGCILIGTVGFYLQRSTKIIFGEQKIIS